MIVPLAELLSTARRAGGAVGAFTAYNLETAIAVARAAEANDLGAILLLSKSSLQQEGAELFLSGVVALARTTRASICVQLDHVDDLALVDLALGAGVGAIMADGSRRPFDENVELVRSVAARAHEVGAQIEAELGHIEGDEDMATAAAARGFTDPGQVLGFLESTSADCLAVSIGNVHGRYAAPPALDWDRLAAIRAATDTPLSLHGGSGLPEADLARALAAGICKVNVNTDLRAAYFGALRSSIPDLEDGLRVGELNTAVIDAVTTAAEAKMRLFSGNRPGCAMTPIRRLDHVALAVESTEAALEFYSGRLGLCVVSTEELETPRVRLTYLDTGNAFLQLVEALDDSSEIARFLRERGEGLHHICFGVDDVRAAVQELEDGDGETRPLGHGRGRPSAFLTNPAHGTVIECTRFEHAPDVAQRAGWLPPSGSLV